ncbi:unnamed protein product [Bemisia tabaci]|uniref:Ionotropic glutamate receptor L-glutamate and glycine-binding domain-containing protein n=2 Tax=Bemisia tabaci TaxID=7038 RepID=A0A9P0EWI8_BEMTA|nr:unnamed protein product [Bemisia tabaci]
MGPRKIVVGEPTPSLNLSPLESDTFTQLKQSLNWTRMISRNFTRMIRTTKKVAESQSVELFLAKVTEFRNVSGFIMNLYTRIGPLFITTRSSAFGADPLAKLVIVVVGDELNVWDLVNKQSDETLWSSTCYYIVVAASIPPDILDLFQAFWNGYFVHNIIFYPTDGTELVSVYNPFKNSSQVTRIQMRNIRAIRSSFVKKMSDLNGYPLRVSIFHTRTKALPLGNGSYSGRDGFLLSTLARRMNFKPVISEPKDGLRYGFKAENGSYTGMLGDLIYDRVDISFNSVFIKDYETTKIQFTRPIDFDKMCLVVAKSGLRSHWEGMFLAFSSEMWLALFIAYLCSISFWSFLRRINSGEYSIVTTILDLYRIFMMFPIAKIPNIQSERIAVASFLWFSLSTATIFQASMVKFLSHPSYRPDINTLKEVAEKNFPVIIGSENLKETFESPEPVMKKLHDNLEVVTDRNMDLLGKVAEEGNSAAMGREKNLEEKIATDYVKNNIILLHIVAECPKAYHIAYMLPHASPFLDPINKVIAIFVESGIIHSWYIHATPVRPLSDYHKFSETYKPLTMSNVVIAFVIIGLGSMLSVFTMAAEIVVHRVYGSGWRESSEKKQVTISKLHRRSQIVYEMTRKRFKPFKVASTDKKGS